MEKEQKSLMEELQLKSAEIGSVSPTDDEMMKINQYTLEDLKAEDVFIFKVAMCDNEIDRDHEVFSLDALSALKDLFVGKTMMKDHAHRNTDGQCARIYATELRQDSVKQTSRGEPYTQLIAHCYMLNTPENGTIISEIKGGIKREVSVGFRAEKATCSICKGDIWSCRHWWGKMYDGLRCYATLDDVSDAYELSFVCVPAQPKAAVTKAMNKPREKAVDADQSANTTPNDFDLRMKEMESFLFSNKERNDDHE